jgi:hypothetical protein
LVVLLPTFNFANWNQSAFPVLVAERLATLTPRESPAATRRAFFVLERAFFVLEFEKLYSWHWPIAQAVHGMTDSGAPKRRLLEQPPCRGSRLGRVVF